MENNDLVSKAVIDISKTANSNFKYVNAQTLTKILDDVRGKEVESAKQITGLKHQNQSLMETIEKELQEY